MLILIADTNPKTHRLLEEKILKPAGCTVVWAGDGAKALQLARESQLDLAIVHHKLPDMSGTELIHKLRREIPFLPSILVADESSEKQIREALRAGATDYFTIPFEAENLLASIGRSTAEYRHSRLALREDREAQIEIEQLRSRIDDLESVAEIGRSMTSMLDVEAVFTSVVEAAVRLTNAEEGTLFLLDEESNELYIRSSKNIAEDLAQTLRLKVDDSLAGQVIDNGKPLLLDQDSPEKIITAYLVRSLIYVPLVVRDRTIGVLGVDNRENERVFSQHDVAVMTSMASFASIAVENAQLYHRSEAELRKLETILEQSENGVIVVDLQGRVELANQAACDAFSVEGDPVGRPMEIAFEDPHLVSLVESHENLTSRNEIELEDGRVFSVQCSPIEGVGLAIVMHDITHLKELDRIKSEFVTTVSHDLRSPLTAILGYVKLIERAGEVNEQQREFIHRVELSVEHITNLVTDLLDLGRIEAGLDMTKEDTPINVIGRYAVENLRSAAEARGLDLEVDLPDELPMIMGNPLRLRQMIGNLLENAIKYTPRGGKVRIEAESENGQVILRVVDTGPGISPADQPYVFDKFFRGSNIPEDLPGTGLGLSIVKSIVDNHKGRIWVDSTVGKGSTFTVVLRASGS